MIINEDIYTNQRSSSADTYFDSFFDYVPNSVVQQLPLVLWTDNVATEGWINPKRHMDFLSLYIARQGRGVHLIEGVPYEISRGDVYAMGFGMQHQFKDDSNLILDTVHFKPEIFPKDTLDALSTINGFTKLYSTHSSAVPGFSGNLSRWMHLSPDSYQSVTSIYKNLYSEWSVNTHIGAIMSRTYLLQLLVILAREYKNISPREISHQSINQNNNLSAIGFAVRFIDENYAEDIRIENLAASAYLSPGRFTELFRMEMGCTPRDYIRHVRIEHVKVLLTTTTISISEIAQFSGFGESAYLTRVFLKATGLQPSRYRQQVKQASVL